MERAQTDSTGLDRFYQWLTAPIDNSQLIVFRIGFGLLLFLEAFGANLTGWVTEVFVDSPYTFNFMGFDFLQNLHGPGMYVYYVIMSMAGLMIMLGWRYRLGSIIYFLMWGGVYFAQKSHYNNHYYFTLLLTGMLIFLPSNGYAALDNKRDPSTRSLTAPRWTILLFIVQIGILYTYGSLAKCNSDWINIKPISIWFDNKLDYPIVGPLLGKEWFRYFVAWGGILFDGLIVPALLWKPTRKLAFISAVLFHLFNSAVFQVGIFPYLGIFLCVFFFPAETIRKLFLRKKPSLLNEEVPQKKWQTPKWFLGIVALYLIWQIYLPLRHFAYPGNMYWTEEGHRLAWQMMARSKSASTYFSIINNKSGEKIVDYPEDSLPRHQFRTVCTRPDVIWQYVQKLKQKHNPTGEKDISIYAHSFASLNGRPSQRYIDPKVDLAKVEWERFGTKSWIVPLKDPGSGYGY